MQAQEALLKVKKGMHVYDKRDNNFGSVLYVYTPDSDLEEAMLPADIGDTARNSFLSEGFIRIGNPIYSGVSFARATDIDRVENDRVYLTIDQSEVLRV